MIEEEQMQNDGPFIFWGENLALDLVNTEVVVRGKRQDLLAHPQDARQWWRAAQKHQRDHDVVRAENEGQIGNDETLLSALKSLRAALRAIFSALVEERSPEKKDIDVLNEVLKTGYASLDLTEQGELVSIYRTADTQKGLILLPIALSALRLISTGERKRLHHCENSRCILFFYDTTKSATRRWCSLGCMDRARSAQRYKEAKKQKSVDKRGI
jgi:predicted RNA-binding Zn ribbon-like protein